MKTFARIALAAAMAIGLMRCGDSKSPSEATPPLSPGIVAGTWTGTYGVNDHDTCLARGIPATASLLQEGAAVGGTLVIEPATCGLDTLDLEGAMNGSSLEGRVLASGKVVSNQVRGGLPARACPSISGKTILASRMASSCFVDDESPPPALEWSA